MEILRVENLSFAYPGAARQALCDVTFSVRAGEFVVLCGETGCGKTTLLRLFKRALAPRGTRRGTVRCFGQPSEAMSEYDAAAKIGFVLQDPEAQIVTDRVFSELAFGAESLGLSPEVIRRRIAETAAWLGIQNWLQQDTHTLSGGQKQLLNLAAVLIMRPDVLLLDEPTAQLDPVASSEFLQTLYRLNREMGLTILLSEHRLEEAFPLSDRVLVLSDGRLAWNDAPQKVAEAICRSPENAMYGALPGAARLFSLLAGARDCPLTVRAGKRFLQQFRFAEPSAAVPPQPFQKPLVKLRDVWFRYAKKAPDVLRGLRFDLYRGEICCILGGNGAGKTTLLQLLAGTKRPWRGRIEAPKGLRAALLPQEVRLLFTEETVQQDLLLLLEVLGVPTAKREERLLEAARALRIEPYLHRHPYDVSGGERQRCALAKALLTEPELLLLDEPTKGLDAVCKRELRALLRRLAAQGVCVLLVTHDVEFAAETADRCALLFDGGVIGAGTPEDFFSENSFYTTAAVRMAHDLCPRAVTCAAVAARCTGKADAPC